MDISDIDKLIVSGEGNTIEFKEAQFTLPSSIYETVVSFSNTDGGTILLGIDKNGNISGIDANEVETIQKNIVSTLNSRDCINPPIYLQPIRVNHHKGIILVLQLPASSQVHDHAGRIYIREHECDIDITGNQHKISEVYIRKRNFFSESQIFPFLSMADLDNTLFDKARQIIRNYRSDHPWLMVSNEQMLKDSILWKKDFLSGQEGLTLAAALIFGRDTTIQSILPAYKVEAMVRIRNTDRWDDRITPPLRTNLIDTYLILKEFIKKHLPETFYLEGDQRIDVRDKVFREIIGNAVVHREYTSALSTDLIISEDEVTITNPNKPLFHGPIDPKGFNPYPKNPNIRKFFTAFGWTDEIGSGIRNTMKYLPLYSEGAIPIFMEGDVFKTLIPLRNITLSMFAEKIQKWLNLPETILPHFKEGLLVIRLAPELGKNDWEHLILNLVPSWHKNGTQLPTLRWPENQIHTEDEIKMAPSWIQNSTQLLTKKVWYLISILLLVSKPLRLSELVNVFNYRNHKYFRENYLIPLRNAGLIAFTNPEKVNDPENSYIITQKGKIFLGGLG